jgi:hypothetical protein
MHAFELCVVAAATVISAVIGYFEGKSRGWRDGVSEAFHPFVAEGHLSGWLARHYGQPLKDDRVHPDELKRLMPTLFDPGQELSDWMFTGSHLPFEEYRAQKVAKLNEELNREKQSKKDA